MSAAPPCGSVRPALLTATLLLASVAGPARADSAGEAPPACLGINALCDAGGNLQFARLVPSPSPELRRRYPGRQTAVYAIDLAEDGHPEYVVQRPLRSGAQRTCFLDDRLEQRRCQDWWPSQAFYVWFVKLKEGQPVYVLAFEEDADSHDFRVEQVDPRTWRRRRVLTIDAVATQRDAGRCRSFWARPDLVRDLPLRTEGGHVLVRVAPRGASGRLLQAGERPRVEFIFEGVPTEETPTHDCEGAVASSRFMTLDEAISFSKQPLRPTTR